MKTNELKKGCRIQLRNGWYATIEDNLKGNTRMATVEGYCTEMGSVYSFDVVKALVNGVWTKIEHTPAQLKLKKSVSIMFGE